METLYDVLDADRTCDAATLKKAYRRAVMRTHPDRNNGDEGAFLRVQDAWETLSDPERRASYDARINGQPPPHVRVDHDRAAAAEEKARATTPPRPHERAGRPRAASEASGRTRAYSTPHGDSEAPPRTAEADQGHHDAQWPTDVRDHPAWTQEGTAGTSPRPAASPTAEEPEGRTIGWLPAALWTLFAVTAALGLWGMATSGPGYALLGVGYVAAAGVVVGLRRRGTSLHRWYRLLVGGSWALASLWLLIAVSTFLMLTGSTATALVAAFVCGGFGTALAGLWHCAPAPATEAGAA